jgi:hypothetical protein
MAARHQCARHGDAALAHNNGASISAARLAPRGASRRVAWQREKCHIAQHGA